VKYRHQKYSRDGKAVMVGWPHSQHQGGSYKCNLDRYIADVARDIDNLATQEDTESGGTFSSYLAGRKYLSLHYWYSTTINLPLKVSG